MLLLYTVISAACCLEALCQRNPICWSLLGLHIASEVLIVDIIYIYAGVIATLNQLLESRI
jgi:hypothetical protein